MKILANAHISRLVFDFLAAEGHDCQHAELISPGLPDDYLLRLAVEQQRVILTADKDFGELVFRRRIAAVGVVLLRLRAASEADRLALFKLHWPVLERNAMGRFLVVTNRRVRRSPLPSAP